MISGKKPMYKGLVIHNLKLLSHSFNHMQEKTQRLKVTASSVGLRINKDKSKIMKVITDCLQTVSLT